MPYQPDHEIDCSGMLCPIPVMKAAAAIQKIDVGQVLKLVATDPGAPPDMEAWSRQTGHELLEQSEEDGKFVFFFKRTK